MIFDATKNERRIPMSVNERNLSITERPVDLKPFSTAAVPTAHFTEEDEIAQLPWMIRLTAICLLATALGWLLSSARLAAPAWLPWILYAIAYASGGFYSIQDAWDMLKQRQFDVNFLMIIAAVGAALIGEPREGAILMFLFSLSNTLETYAMGRTHASVRALLDMAPKEADVYHDGQIVRIPVEDLRVGAVVLVRPGAQIPADGQVVKGESAVDEASITGESMPVEKRPGARTFAGTLNGQGALDMRVTTPVGDSTLARIVAVVREAREQKAQSQDFTYRAMTLMVVASPCALVISIPAALLSTLASAARGGVLFKGGRHLEAAARVKVVAFDKTGTLTTGRPGVVALIPVGGPGRLPDRLPCLACYPRPDDDQLGDLTPEQIRLLSVAAAIEHASEHPLARAILKSAEEREIPIPDATDFEAQAGAGATATALGRAMRIGRPSMFGQLTPDVAIEVQAQEIQGRTVVALGDDLPWGLIAIADTMRPEAASAVAQLKAAGVERVVLLTGDNKSVATALGTALGVDEIRAELLPHQKVEAIRELQGRYGPVAMVGDGVNDAPALATAALGVAMGAAGTDVALESADMLLMGDDLGRLPGALALAGRTRTIIRQNLTFAFAVMATLMVLAIVGNIALPLGVVGHEGSTLLVCLNGLRLLAMRWR